MYVNVCARIYIFKNINYFYVKLMCNYYLQVPLINFINIMNNEKYIKKKSILIYNILKAKYWYLMSKRNFLIILNFIFKYKDKEKNYNGTLISNFLYQLFKYKEKKHNGTFISKIKFSI